MWAVCFGWKCELFGCVAWLVGWVGVGCWLDWGGWLVGCVGGCVDYVDGGRFWLVYNDFIEQ